jgi:hypothetical protein
MVHDELDMLEVRLRELAGRVDWHVIAESPVDHRGRAKPLHYRENAARFAPWADRIVYVMAGLPDSPDPWVREHAQRDLALPVVTGGDDDLVLICDVDEFPSPAALRSIPETAFALNMRMAMYAVDWLYPEKHLCSVLAKLGHVREAGSLAKVRDARYDMKVIEDGGWHLTWLGGVAAQRRKLDRDCHTDRTAYESSLIRKGRCYREGIHHSGKLRMIPAEVDETWPRMIYEGQCPREWYRPRT